MPKGKRKDRRGRDQHQPSDDDCDTPDNASIISSLSDCTSTNGEGDDIEEVSVQENFEEKVKDIIDGLSQKSAKGRTESVICLKVALAKKYFYDFIVDRKITILDGLERCLKKGKGEEQAQAAIGIVLLSIQLGGSDDSEEIFRQLSPLLTITMTDTSASLKTRTSCATALGMMAFIGSRDLLESIEVMQSLEKIFSASYFKGDRTAPSHDTDICALHNAALISWCLLLSISPSSTVQKYLVSHLPKLPQLLESHDVDLRITAGESIALLYELAREGEDHFKGPNMHSLCDHLKQLATDGNRHRAKKDRRQQRSSFRDILRTIQEGEAPYDNIKCGTENIEIDSWSRKRQYDCLCHVLGSGMNTHLLDNQLIRDMFDLGPPELFRTKPTRATKIERTLYNAAAFKARTKVRSKNRDKRAVSSMYS